MDSALVTLTAAALSGLASVDRRGLVENDEATARRAVAMARSALALLEDSEPRGRSAGVIDDDGAVRKAKR